MTNNINDHSPFLQMNPLFSVMASVGVDVGVSSEGSWSDREMAAGRKLTGIAIKESESVYRIARIRAR